MKKLSIFFLLLPALLCACRAEAPTPEPIGDCAFDAVCSTGDFDFRCHIKRRAGTVYVTVLNTQAKGMTMSCDGKTVLFSRGNLLRRIQKERADVTNPARLLWEVFTAQDSGGTQTSLGHFVLEQENGKVKRIVVGDIVIEALQEEQAE